MSAIPSTRKKAPTFDPLATTEGREVKAKRNAKTMTKKAKAKRRSPSGEGAAKSEVLPPFDCFFDDRKDRYYFTDAGGIWRGYSVENFKRRLRANGIDGRAAPGALLSPQDEVILRVQDHHGIDFAGALAGYSAGFLEMNGSRVLVTCGPRLPVPAVGEWATLKRFLSELFGVGLDAHGQTQFTVFSLWAARAWRSIGEGLSLRGQALLIAGPASCGKNLLQEVVVTEILGGRLVKAGDFLTGETAFNGFLFAGEHLVISDETVSRDIRARRELGQRIKGIVANESHSMHHKGRDPLTVNPRWRLTLSVNDETEHLQTLPPVGDRDIRDKVHLLRVWPASFPVDEAERVEWLAALRREIPAFLAAALALEVPRHLLEVRPRFGHREFHHPELLERLNSFSPELHLLGLIDRLLFEEVKGTPFEDGEPWEGSASELRSKLLDAGADRSVVQKEIGDLLRSAEQCGQYLSRLKDHHPERVEELPRTGNKRGWRILPPAREGEVDAN